MDSAPATPTATDSGAAQGAIENQEQEQQQEKKAVSTTTPAPDKGESTSTQPPKQGETTQTPKPKHKLKARDKEIEVDEEQLRHYAQKAFGIEAKLEAARQEAEEAKQIKAQLEALKNPQTQRQVLKELMGDGFISVAEQELTERMALEQAQAQMSDKERALYRHMQEQERIINEFRGKEEQAQRQQQEQMRQFEYQAIRERIEDTTAAAIESLKFPEGLRPTIARRMLPHIETAIDQQVPLDHKAIATYAIQEMRDEFGAVANALDGEGLYNWLGDEVAKKLLRYSIDRRLKGASPTTPTAVPQTGTPSFSVDPKPQRRSPLEALKRPKWDEVEAQWQKLR